MVRDLRTVALAALVAAGASACATPSTHYHWGNYDEALKHLREAYAARPAIVQLPTSPLAGIACTTPTTMTVNIATAARVWNTVTVRATSNICVSSCDALH